MRRHRKDDAMIFQATMEKDIGRNSPQVAKALGISYTKFRHELNPYRDDYKFGLLAFHRYLLVTGYRETLRWICRDAGGVFIPLGRPLQPVSDHWLQEVVELFHRADDVAGAICTVIDPASDGGELIMQSEVPIFQPPIVRMIDHAVGLREEMLANVVLPAGERRRAS